MDIMDYQLPKPRPIIPGSLSIQVATRRIVRIGFARTTSGKRRRQALNRAPVVFVQGPWVYIGGGKNLTINLKSGEIKMLAVSRTVIPGAEPVDQGLRVSGADGSPGECHE